MNVLTINFNLSSCSPPPDGIRVYYRPLGTSGPYRVTGVFSSSPAVIPDTNDADGTQYEGYYVAVCAGVETIETRPFTTECTGASVTVLVANNSNTANITAGSPGNFEVKIVALHPSNTPSGSLVQIADSGGSYGTGRILTAEVGPAVVAGETYRFQIYSHVVEVVAVFGDTPASIVNKLVAAINATTSAGWNEFGSAPPPGTPGYPPFAFLHTDFPNRIQVRVNWQNLPAWSVVGGLTASCDDPAVWQGNINSGDFVQSAPLPNGNYRACLRRSCGGGSYSTWTPSENFAITYQPPAGEANIIEGVGFGSSEAAACANGAPNVVYVSAPATEITVGVQVFTNAALTISLGSGYLRDPNGTLWAVNAGYVYAATGNVC